MFDLVFFDVTVGNGMNTDTRLATLARAIWFGTRGCQDMLFGP